jgi:integrase
MTGRNGVAKGSGQAPRLNEEVVKGLPIPDRGNRVYYFAGAILQGSRVPDGLGVRVTAAGDRSFVMNYRNSAHKERRYTFASYPDWSVLAALKEARELRKRIDRGEDPMAEREAAAETARHAALPRVSSPTYETVVKDFIELYAKPRQRTWDQTERILLGTNKAPHPWLQRPIHEITKQDARTLLNGYLAQGYDYKASVSRAWLRKLFKWAAQNDYLETSIMEAVAIEIDKRKRDRFFTDEEIKATWAATNQLDPAEASYVKLLMLLAPRKTSLACITRQDLNADCTLWTVPFELTKSWKKSAEERTYLVPLSPLCQRLFKGLITEEMQPSDRLFPDLPVHRTRGGQRGFDDRSLKDRLKVLGAPSDFHAHAWRLTVASHLKNKGYSKWERGLVLNHAEGGVTADYSHGYPLELKLKLLTTWAEHIERLVQPPGAALLRRPNTMRSHP